MYNEIIKLLKLYLLKIFKFKLYLYFAVLEMMNVLVEPNDKVYSDVSFL